MRLHRLEQQRLPTKSNKLPRHETFEAWRQRGHLIRFLPRTADESAYVFDALTFTIHFE